MSDQDRALDEPAAFQPGRRGLLPSDPEQGPDPADRQRPVRRGPASCGRPHTSQRRSRGGRRLRTVTARRATATSGRTCPGRCADWSARSVTTRACPRSSTPAMVERIVELFFTQDRPVRATETGAVTNGAASFSGPQEPSNRQWVPPR